MYLLIIITVLFIISLLVILKSRNMQLWITSYLKQILSKQNHSSKVQHIYVCLADHFEPYYGNVTESVARELVDRWVDAYKNIAKNHTDSNGNYPKHTYFYPEEEYDEYIINKLKVLCDEGMGDLEIHLHHDDDTADNLKRTLIDFKNLLYNKHGFLRKNTDGDIVYGFIHGNWALDNSRPDGRWCGIDNEIDVLIDTGCEFDMTMPSAPSDTQTKTINSIYFAKEDGKCKSHNTGIKTKVGRWKNPDELLMIQGPLTLNWTSRKMGIIPRIESSELSGDAPPTMSRIQLWENCRISVKGRDNHVFIKLHTHGLQSQNMDMFINNNGFNSLWNMLESKYKNNNKYKLHYVTAWEMYLKIKELAAG